MPRGKQRRRKPVRCRQSKEEGTFAEFLDSQRIVYRRQYEVRLENGRRAYLDFYFPASRIGVELIGRSHNGRWNEDLKRLRAIRKAARIRVHVLWNSEALNPESHHVRRLIAAHDAGLADRLIDP